MTDDDRTSRLRLGDELWITLTRILDAHLREPIGPSTDWTGHDVYAHFARWQTHAAWTLRQLAAREPAPAVEGDENEINERWRASDRSLDTETVRVRCEATRTELRAALLAFDAEQWSRFGGHISAEDITGEHYAHHLADAGLEPS
jgi:hypothetical protein